MNINQLRDGTGVQHRVVSQRVERDVIAGMLNPVLQETSDDWVFRAADWRIVPVGDESQSITGGASDVALETR